MSNGKKEHSFRITNMSLIMYYTRSLFVYLHYLPKSTVCSLFFWYFLFFLWSHGGIFQPQRIDPVTDNYRSLWGQTLHNVTNKKQQYLDRHRQSTWRYHRCDSESINRRRSDNAMAKWKKGKMINNDQQNITHKAKHRVLRTPVKTEVELRWSRRVGSLCSTSDICRVTLVTNPMISHEWGKNRKVEHICGHGGDRKSANWEISIIYAEAAGMLLHINGKFTMGRLKSSLLS